MKHPRQIQVYLSKRIEVEKIVLVLTAFLKTNIATLDNPDSQAQVFMQFLDYQEGYPMGINLIYSPSFQRLRSNIEVAKVMSQQLGILVATDLPETDNPFRWYLVDSAGKVMKMTEDLEGHLNANGLVLKADNIGYNQNKGKSKNMIPVSSKINCFLKNMIPRQRWGEDNTNLVISNKYLAVMVVPS